MSDTLSAARLEPETRPGERVVEIAPGPVAAPAVPAVTAPPTDPDVAAGSAKGGTGGLDQLSRIEDKTARIEEKYARSEARMQRVVDKVDAAMDRMSNVALQGDLAAVRGEVGVISRRLKTLPGFGAMVVTAAITAFLTVACLIALLRYYPALLAR